MQSTRDTSSGHQLKPFLAIIIIVILAPNSYCQWPTYTADLLISKTSGIETMEKDSIASYKVTFEGKPNPSAQILTASIEVICSEGQRLLKVRYPHTTAETIVTQNRIGTYMISGRVDVLRPKSHPHIDLSHYKRIPAVRSANLYMTWPYGLIRQHVLVRTKAMNIC